MKKILPFIISPIGYFPADMLALSILETYNDSDALLYGFYNMFGNYCYHRDESITLNAELNWECPLLSRKFVPRSILADMVDTSLIKFIESCINNNYYVYITLDRCKMKCYINYGGLFSPHPLTIYGFDNDNKEFYIADFTDGKKYLKTVVAYDELVDANESMQKNMSLLDISSGSNEWILDIELVKYLQHYNMNYNVDYIRHSIELFLQGRSLNGNICSLHQRLQPQITISQNGNMIFYEAEISNEFYGINVLKNIIIHIEKCLNYPKYKFNFRHIYLVFEYICLMEIKFTKLYQLEDYRNKPEFEEILFRIGTMKENISVAVNLSLKYTYSRKLKDLQEILKIVDNEIEQIEKVNRTILNILKG